MGIERKRAGRFNYIDAGSGFPLILLHGLMGNLSNFSETIDYFSKKNYRVIAPCLPMYELPLLKTNVTSFAQYLDDLIKWLAIKRVTLIGNSLGGHIALIYTKRRPEMIHSVVLTGSSGLYENAVGNSFPKRKNVEYIRKKALDVFHDPDMVTDELVAELFELVNDRNKIIKTLSVAKSAIRHNMAGELNAFRMPFCLIWGRDDKVTPPDVAEDFHRLLPDSDLYWIDRCGHAPMMEKPEEFNEILDKWLSRFSHLTHAN